MFIGHHSAPLPPIEVASGPAFTLLVHLAAASRDARPENRVLTDALAAVGDTEGETWLNLLGVPLDAGPPYGVSQLLRALQAMDGVELRRHLLGRFAWSWCTLAGIDDIESAAVGNADAARRLLEHPRYYGGRAAASLATLLPLDADETRLRVVRAVEAASHALLSDTTARDLAAATEKATTLLADRPALSAIEQVTGGYRYVPEVEAEQIVLIPHLEPAVPLVLAQHRAARLIVHVASTDRGPADRLVAIGRALSDPKRVEILELVGRGVRRAGELVDVSGLSRSTVHHHLAQLREAGLVALEGNARAYTYAPRRDAAAQVAALLAEVVGANEESE